MPDAAGSGYRRIVVGFDGSPSSEDALSLALRLRDPGDGCLLLTCVVAGHPWHLTRRTAHGEAGAAEAKAMLAEARARIPAGVPVTLRAPVASSTSRGLTELAEAERADLVVVGSAKGSVDGRIGLTRTAGRLLAGAPCAVAVAPPDLREDEPFRHIGVAVDGSPEAAAALQAGYTIARGNGSAVTLFSALDATMDTTRDDALLTRRAIQERLDASADAAPPGLNPRTVFLHGPAGREIAEACDGVVDLLVTGSRAYGPVQRALLGSVSEELIARARHPVLVIPRPPGDERAGRHG